MSNWSWLLGSLATIVVIAGIIVYVNPRGMYGTHFFVPWANPSRQIKPQAYLDLPQTPDIAIMGSSRAFTISPTYINQKFGYSAFNFALDAGQINDFLIDAKFMADVQDHKLPKVLLIEVADGFFTDQSYAAIFSPASMWPYMDLPTIQMALQERFEGLFNLQQFAEALFITRYYYFNHTLFHGWVFDAQGGGVFTFHPDLQAAIDNAIKRTSYCMPLPQESVQAAQALIDLVQEHKSAVIFYVPPTPSRIFKTKIQDNLFHNHCSAQFMEYMRNLTQRYDNIFFLDFGDLKRIGGIDSGDGFYDDTHLTPLNNNRLIDTAAATINRAYQLSIHERALP